MPQAPHSAVSRRRAVALAMALVALVLKLAVPPGFMAAGAAGGGLVLTLCSEQGLSQRIAPASHEGQDAPSKSPGADAPCAFAGHGAAYLTAPAHPTPARLAVAYVISSPPAPTALAPGRGLAAPPPARGPPPTA